MSVTRPDFLAIEIDNLDAKLDERLAETARRKRIPSLTRDAAVPVAPGSVSSEGLGGDSPNSRQATRKASQRPSRKTSEGHSDGTPDRPVDGISVPEPAHRPGEAEGPERGRAGQPTVLEEGRQAVRRRPLSLEVPDYLARELKVRAATEGVTVRFLVLSALAGAGYRVDSDELEEDGRRLR